MKYGIHGSHVCQQCLGRTNIGSGFFAFDVLFSCLQSHTQCAVALCIDAYTDDSTGHVSFKLITGSKESCMRTTETQWHTKR